MFHTAEIVWNLALIKEIPVHATEEHKCCRKKNKSMWIRLSMYSTHFALCTNWAKCVINRQRSNLCMRAVGINVQSSIMSLHNLINIYVWLAGVRHTVFCGEINFQGQASMGRAGSEVWRGSKMRNQRTPC